MTRRDFLKLYTEISSLTWIFHEKRAATGSRDSFQNFERHCSKTALYEKKWWIPTVALKILKLVWEPVLRPQDQDYPPIYCHFLTSLWSNHCYVGFRWSNRADLFRRKMFRIDYFFLAVFLGSPGSVRLLRLAGNRFYDKKIDFYDKKSGIREPRVRRRFRQSRVRRRKPRNLEWADGGPRWSE